MDLTIEVSLYDILQYVSQEELNWNKLLIERYIGREVNIFSIHVSCVYLFILHSEFCPKLIYLKKKKKQSSTFLKKILKLVCSYKLNFFKLKP